MDKREHALESAKKLKENSLKGESGVRERERATIRESKYKRDLKKMAIATALSVSLVIGGGALVFNHARETIIANEMAYDFYVEVISPETHRTDNNKYYYYDYDDIADKIEAMEDPDLGFFLFYKWTGTVQVDRVLQQTMYGSFDTYLTAHGYANEKEFRKDMTHRAALINDINDKEEELEGLREEHSNLADREAGTYGGTK